MVVCESSRAATAHFRLCAQGTLVKRARAFHVLNAAPSHLWALGAWGPGVGRAGRGGGRGGVGPRAWLCRAGGGAMGVAGGAFAYGGVARRVGAPAFLVVWCGARWRRLPVRRRVRLPALQAAAPMGCRRHGGLVGVAYSGRVGTHLCTRVVVPGRDNGVGLGIVLQHHQFFPLDDDGLRGSRDRHVAIGQEGPEGFCCAREVIPEALLRVRPVPLEVKFDLAAARRVDVAVGPGPVCVLRATMNSSTNSRAKASELVRILIVNVVPRLEPRTSICSGCAEHLAMSGMMAVRTASSATVDGVLALTIVRSVSNGFVGGPREPVDDGGAELASVLGWLSRALMRAARLAVSRAVCAVVASTVLVRSLSAWMASPCAAWTSAMLRISRTVSALDCRVAARSSPAVGSDGCWRCWVGGLHTGGSASGVAPMGGEPCWLRDRPLCGVWSR